MHALPRKLSLDELTELFEGPTRFLEVLAEREDPLRQARVVLADLPEEDVVAALNAHPRIGQRRLTGRSAQEQGSEDDPALMAALVRLNKAYEEKFGFRFVIFVDRRPRAEILPVLRERLQRDREQELAAACDELVAIAHDRWRSR